MTNIEATTPDKTAAVGAQTAHVAPEKAPSKKAATAKKGALKGRTAAKGAKTGKTKAAKTQAAAPKKAAKSGKKPARAAKPAAAKKATAPRAESKGAKILDMIRRPKGATLAEIMKATDWQAHSVRGFISTAAKKHGIKIESTKNEAGDRLYKSIE
jgi:hypothetical protein